MNKGETDMIYGTYPSGTCRIFGTAEPFGGSAEKDGGKMENERITGVIAAGGDLDPGFTALAVRALKERYASSGGRLLVCAADRGLEALLQAGISPELLVGDFDSADPGKLERALRIPGLKVERHDPVKDASDLELACGTLFRAGAERIFLLGALGGRMDHELANFRLLFHEGLSGHEIVILDPRNRIRCLVPGTGHPFEARLRRESQWGRYISFLPAGGPVTIESLSGVKYPLEKHRLTEQGTPSLTISNEITGGEALIRFTAAPDAGLYVIETSDRPVTEIPPERI